MKYMNTIEMTEIKEALKPICKMRAFDSDAIFYHFENFNVINGLTKIKSSKLFLNVHYN